MKTVRYGSFETNSSSTHAIVVPKQANNEEYDLYDSLDHDYAFGREECRLCDNWDEKLAYAYMMLINNYEWSHYDDNWKPQDATNKDEIDDFKKRVIAIWKQLETNKRYNPTPQDVFNYIDRKGDDGDLTGNDTCLILKERYGNYIDHANGLDGTDFVARLKTDDEFVKRFIFNRDSYITIGGDEFRGYNIKTIGFEYDYDSEGCCVNEDWEKPPADWFDKDGHIKDEYWDRYCKEYPYDNSDFWKKLKEYEKNNDVYLKGN